MLVLTLFVWATALPGEKATHVTQCLLQRFAVISILAQIKIDNGPFLVINFTIFLNFTKLNI